MDISAFTDTRIRFTIDGEEKVYATNKGGIPEAINEMIKLAQSKPGAEIKITSASIVKKKGNRTHELFV